MGNNKKPNTKKPKSDAKDTKDKTCTWCAKHHPRIQKGHLWHECRKLKEFNEVKKKAPDDSKDNKDDKKKKQKKESEKANMAIESSVIESDSAANSVASTVNTTSSRSHKPHQKFMFDTGASSHMTSDIGRFHTFRSVHGVVEIANGQFIDYVGKGTVLLNCVLLGCISTSPV